MLDRGHVHQWEKRQLRIDYCHFVLVVRRCADCHASDETEIERDFEANPMQIAFAREDCARGRVLAYGREPESWAA